MNRLDFSSLGFDGLIDHEWLTANGIGGYACSTVAGLNTRKYHGLLVAAMAPPVRRMVLLARVDDALVSNGQSYPLATAEYPGTVHPQGYQSLRAFAHEPFPRWAFQADGFTVEKSLRLIKGQNTVCLTYTLLAGHKSAELTVRPLLALRGIHELMFQWNGPLTTEHKARQHHRVPPTSRTPEVFFAHDGHFADDPVWYLNGIYRREQERGYAGLEDLWNPGVVRFTIAPGQTVHLVCSTDPIDLEDVKGELDRQEALVAVSPVATSNEVVAALERATEQFIATVPQDMAGAERVAVISQYPWSAPSPRWSLIGFAGLFLIPGRFDQGRRLLEKLAGLLKNGLIPSELPETGGEPVYHGADVALWFVNAICEYVRYTGDEALGKALLPAVETILENYQRGTALGITADADGLVASRAPGLPTTWMDAKVSDWVVTPRQGRPVELNALWYNALRIGAELAGRFGHATRAHALATLADSVKAAFNRRFWNPDARCLFDVVDDHGSDPAVRPNQVFSISLPYPVLDPERHEAVLDAVVEELLTPVGVRTLSPRDPAYQGRYLGGIVSRDRAAHNGSAYPWLLGPLVTAHLRVHGRGDGAMHDVQQWLAASIDRVTGEGFGLLPELFDGSAPHRPGGAIASAASTAEFLRAYVQDVLGILPGAKPTAPVSSSTNPVGGTIPAAPRA